MITGGGVGVGRGNHKRQVANILELNQMPNTKIKYQKRKLLGVEEHAVIPALRWQGQEDGEFKASLGYTVRPC
jgi:hypothetical protein